MKFKINIKYNHGSPYPWGWQLYRVIEGCDVDSWPCIKDITSQYTHRDFAINAAKNSAKIYTENVQLEESFIYEV